MIQMNAPGPAGPAKIPPADPTGKLNPEPKATVIQATGGVSAIGAKSGSPMSSVISTPEGPPSLEGASVTKAPIQGIIGTPVTLRGNPVLQLSFDQKMQLCLGWVRDLYRAYQGSGG